MHLLTLEALIGVCSKLKSFVVDFTTSTSMYYYKHCIIALDFHSTISSNILFLLGNRVLACYNLGDTFWHLNKVFCLFFQDEGSQGEELPKRPLNPKSPIHKHSKIDLAYE
jgi:hypothetical protein